MKQFFIHHTTEGVSVICRRVQIQLRTELGNKDLRKQDVVSFIKTKDY